MRKILYSPGFGAGWSTWSGGELAKFMLEYEPIIEFLEKGGDFVEIGKWRSTKEVVETPWLDFQEPGASVLKRFVEECKARFGDSPYLGGAGDLRVRTVDGPVHIAEYDGSESVETPDNIDWM